MGAEFCFCWWLLVLSRCYFDILTHSSQNKTHIRDNEHTHALSTQAGARAHTFAITRSLHTDNAYEDNRIV